MGFHSEIAKNNLIISFSFNNVLPIITLHLNRFQLIRDHLIRHGFIARASLGRIQNNEQQTEADITLDHAQLPPGDPAWDVAPPEGTN